MKKAKKADEKNSLEQLLLRWKGSYEANKIKTRQFVLVFLCVVIVVLLSVQEFSAVLTRAIFLIRPTTERLKLLLPERACLTRTSLRR